MQSSGSFGCGGGRRIHARLRLEGVFGDGYADFLHGKAQQLSLTLNLAWDDLALVAEITGPEALIGAFEMSAVIGLQDCQIDTWTWVEWRDV